MKERAIYCQEHKVGPLDVWYDCDMCVHEAYEIDDEEYVEFECGRYRTLMDIWKDENRSRWIGLPIIEILRRIHWRKRRRFLQRWLE